MSDGMDYGQSERSQWFAELATLRADLAARPPPTSIPSNGRNVEP